ncbi:hypothetical protein MTZ49_04835 [Entomomonas sp. E2T0]|uniref:hypothetical protein n=1 Tax=Entomomonas sp. E2T0 TaxID=2930213 RepID=UPI0022281394|nr:hypothetical protein [Entomomonas sp. E2T0]UYZ84891.1 hypothetical protein MTZ49_04835 [Entomomonas sp. E2T0]
MIYLVDAWLECAHPSLRILNKNTGEVCLTLNEQEVISYQEQGIFDVASLFSTNQEVIQELTNDLFIAKHIVYKL